MGEILSGRTEASRALLGHRLREPGERENGPRQKLHPEDTMTHILGRSIGHFRQSVKEREMLAIAQGSCFNDGIALRAAKSVLWGTRLISGPPSKFRKVGKAESLEQPMYRQPEGGAMDAGEKTLKDKKVLIVDDEPDVLDTLEDILHMCDLTRASTFEEAKKQLQGKSFDLAILDIMGVNGYALLEIAVARDVTAVMLTAHALTPQDAMKSFKGGAAYFVPKDKMSSLVNILADILEAQKKGKSTWVPFMGWADAYYKTKFGPRWEDRDKEFWKKFREQG